MIHARCQRGPIEPFSVERSGIVEPCAVVELSGETRAFQRPSARSA